MSPVLGVHINKYFNIQIRNSHHETTKTVRLTSIGSLKKIIIIIIIIIIIDSHLVICCVLPGRFNDSKIPVTLWAAVIPITRPQMNWRIKHITQLPPKIWVPFFVGTQLVSSMNHACNCWSQQAMASLISTYVKKTYPTWFQVALYFVWHINQNHQTKTQHLPQSPGWFQITPTSVGTCYRLF